MSWVIGSTEPAEGAYLCMVSNGNGGAYAHVLCFGKYEFTPPDEPDEPTLIDGQSYDEDAGVVRGVGWHEEVETFGGDFDYIVQLYGVKGRPAVIRYMPIPPEQAPRTCVTLSGNELKDALEFVAPDGDAEQLDDDVAIEYSSAGHSGPGYYAHLVECPEEGSILLGGPNFWSVRIPGPDDVFAMASKKAAEARKVEHDAAIREWYAQQPQPIDPMLPALENMLMVVEPWQGSAESHAENLRTNVYAEQVPS